jgi:hypothetical protein
MGGQMMYIGSEPESIVKVITDLFDNKAFIPISHYSKRRWSAFYAYASGTKAKRARSCRAKSSPVERRLLSFWRSCLFTASSMGQQTQNSVMKPQLRNF